MEQTDQEADEKRGQQAYGEHDDQSSDYSNTPEESNESSSSGDESDDSSSDEEDDYSVDEDEVSSDSFEQVYQCRPLSRIEKSLPENGDKIIMPTSALERLINLEIQFPMQFEIRNHSTGRVSHCGVLEFSGSEGFVFLPLWMMENMRLEEGDRVVIKNASLNKGTYMKIQPHTTDFIRVLDMKSMLEDILRSFSCLTVGDTIMIQHNGKKFHIDILETKPYAAINIIDTDCEVEFAPPLDYKEPEKPARKNVAVKDQEEPVMEEKKFIPFSGLARRLDGKISTETAVPELSSGVKKSQLDAAEKTEMLSSGETQNLHKGKGVKIFKDDEKKFQPFTGRKYKLSD